MSTAPLTIQLLFPMGGLGTRFSNIGIATPKPLIHVDGVPMITKAVSSFRHLAGKGATIRNIFVVRAEHVAQFDMVNLLKGAGFADAEYVIMNENTGGAAETCLLAKAAILPDMPLVVMDCDLYFQSAAYDAQILRLQEDGVAGLLLYFKSRNARYSYAKLADAPAGSNVVVQTAEKDPISDHALIGAYGFGSGAVFVRAAEQLLAMPLNPATGMKEYYLSLLYNFILADGGKVVAVPKDEYSSFGTPEELELYKQGKPSHMEE
jgi:dTDP-glucose pyrophosphorylase